MVNSMFAVDSLLVCIILGSLCMFKTVPMIIASHHTELLVL